MTNNDMNVLELLVRISASNGSKTVIQRLREIQQTHPAISADIFQQVLIQDGRIGSFDAQKLASYFTKNN
jgi:hypothetical protein